jgi:hypothetical protein
MSLPVHRSIKNPTWTRRNFARRDWTSIGLRGAHVSRKTRARTKLESAGSGLCHTHMEELRTVGFNAPASHPPLTTSAPSEKDWRELFWLGLIMFSIAAAAALQAMK